MIPNINAALMSDVVFAELPSRTFKLHIDDNVISGHIDNADALKQAIYLILNTERYRYIIYSWDYGVELSDIIGKPVSLAKSVIKRRITEALLQDTRIYDVNNFEFDTYKNNVHVTFTVNTIYGDVIAEKEVKV